MKVLSPAAITRSSGHCWMGWDCCEDLKISREMRDDAKDFSERSTETSGWRPSELYLNLGRYISQLHLIVEYYFYVRYLFFRIVQRLMLMRYIIVPHG